MICVIAIIEAAISISELMMRETKALFANYR